MDPAARVEQPIRILIVDDHRLFAEALEAILAAESTIEVVGRARNGAEALEVTPDLVPGGAAGRVRAYAARLERRCRRGPLPRRRRGRLRDEGPDRLRARRGDPRDGRSLGDSRLGDPGPATVQAEQELG